MTRTRKHFCHNGACVNNATFAVWRKADGTDRVTACGSHLASAVRGVWNNGVNVQVRMLS